MAGNSTLLQRPAVMEAGRKFEVAMVINIGFYLSVEELHRLRRGSSTIHLKFDNYRLFR